jgi:hypothetical protein
MKPFVMLGAILSMVTLSLTAAAAQPQTEGQMPMGGPAGQQAPGQPPMRGGGMMGPGMMGMMCPMMGGGMMPMMRPMMGGMMDPSGTGMMGGGRMDPKAMGRMLQMRGDMLKAVGEVMQKHGKAMEEGR